MDTEQGLALKKKHNRYLGVGFVLLFVGMFFNMRGFYEGSGVTLLFSGFLFGASALSNDRVKEYEAVTGKKW